MGDTLQPPDADTRSEDPFPIDLLSTHRSETRRIWVGVFIALLALVTTTSIILLSPEPGPVPPFVSGEIRRVETQGRPRASKALRLAGSGSNIPVTRALASAFAERGALRPLVPPSIGSSGGLRALLDGAIDIAMISRPISDDDLERGLVIFPYAIAPVVVAVHPNVPQQSLSSQDLVAIYAGTIREWSDGSPIVVLQRELGDSSHHAFDRHLPGFEAANLTAHQATRWRVLYHDAAMRNALESTEGAIGLNGSGRAPHDTGYRALIIDGVAPTPQNVARGAYRYSKTLSFVTIGPPQGDAARFIAFVHSLEGQAVLQAHDLLPISTSNKTLRIPTKPQNIDESNPVQHPPK